jgi:hypothetical protein
MQDDGGMSDQSCVKRVVDGYHAYPCGKKGKVERGGKWYCGMHDPIKLAERRSAKDAERNARWAREDAIRELNRAVNNAEAALEEAVLQVGQKALAAFPAIVVAMKALDDARVARNELESK